MIRVPARRGDWILSRAWSSRFSACSWEAAGGVTVVSPTRAAIVVRLKSPRESSLDHGLAAPIFDLGLDLEGRRLGILVGHVAKLTRYEQLGGARHVHAPFRELVEQGLGDGGAAGRCLAGGISLGDEVAHLDHVSPVLDHSLDLLGQLPHFLVEVAGGASR